MTRPVQSLQRMAVGLVALSCLVLLPAWAAAQKVIVKNDTTTPLIVQGSCVVKGLVQRGRPVQVQPGDSVTMMHPGVVKLIITIADARSPVVPIGQAQVLPAMEDQHFSIQSDVPPKVKLEPVKPPR